MRRTILIALAVLLAAGAAAWLWPRAAQLSDASHGAMLQVARSSYPKVVRNLESNYFGNLRYSSDGAHMGSPIPVRTVVAGFDTSRPVLSQLEPRVDEYVVPVLNGRDQVLGEFVVERGSKGWEFGAAGRSVGGGYAENLSKARVILQAAVGTDVTVIGRLGARATWFVVSRTGSAERGVALFATAMGSLGDPTGRVYTGAALRKWVLATDGR